MLPYLNVFSSSKAQKPECFLMRMCSLTRMCCLIWMCFRRQRHKNQLSQTKKSTLEDGLFHCSKKQNARVLTFENWPVFLSFFIFYCPSANGTRLPHKVSAPRMPPPPPPLPLLVSDQGTLTNCSWVPHILIREHILSREHIQIRQHILVREHILIRKHSIKRTFCQENTFK